eukprot:CAMPEP_0174746714 /NCGR_PEP_ID=MMETSP1094-20130205/89699_1 /TAXON_ID=156173 /ORGANISM="Chrysochromulina brevifilum, Strain UTEX LB 985" /LENGTH=91 /DNA_ID=CAMNT_0015951479 /DNA_START=161 /DNA_END=436 /DNA_ORIENTATION=+
MTLLAAEESNRPLAKFELPAPCIGSGRLTASTLNGGCASNLYAIVAYVPFVSIVCISAKYVPLYATAVAEPCIRCVPRLASSARGAYVEVL